jgi:hypothetical protein
LGNHAFEEVPDELKSTIVSRYGMPGHYYAFNMKDWRFLVLDGTELAAYSRYIHPELAEEGDSIWNSVQGMINEASWNGGISKVQQAWIRSEIEDAVDSGQNVMVFCHFPVYPDSGDHNLWNDHDIVALLEQYPNVVSYVNGHLHLDNYGYRSNIHYYTQNAMLDTPDSTAFSIMSIYPREMVIQGFGRVPDRILPYDNFKTKMVQIFLSDTILCYSHLKNDLTGKLSHTSSDTSMPVNYFIDTARYHNRFFSISNDSLMLNTDEDLSLISDLKISVIAVDCDADTFSQTFHIWFDTTVMRFRYPLSDTVISVYEDYNILFDSLMEDHSKAGMDISLFAAAPEMVIFKDTLDTIKIMPQKVGGTEIFLNAYDPFTGRNYQQAFNLEIYDPLNHVPYHPDTLITDYVVQLLDTAIILLTDIFIDPDGDIPEYFVTINDTSIAAGVLQNEHLLITGLQAGKTILSVTANDNRGGLDSIKCNLRVNTAPFHPDTINVSFNIRVNERLSIYLHYLFLDPDDDTLSFGYVLSGPAGLDVMLVNDSLKILGSSPGIAGLTVTADDHYGGTDTVNITVLIEETPDLLNENITTVNDLKIFPNPASDILHIEFESIEEMSLDISLSDHTGRILHQSDGLKVNQGYNHYEIKTEGMISKGFYYLILHTDNEQQLVKSILIK